MILETLFVFGSFVIGILIGASVSIVKTPRRAFPPAVITQHPIPPDVEFYFPYGAKSEVDEVS